MTWPTFVTILGVWGVGSLSLGVAVGYVLDRFGR